jgi:hypothetical protein
MRVDQMTVALARHGEGRAQASGAIHVFLMLTRGLYVAGLPRVGTDRLHRSTSHAPARQGRARRPGNHLDVLRALIGAVATSRARLALVADRGRLVILISRGRMRRGSRTAEGRFDGAAEQPSRTG